MRGALIHAHGEIRFEDRADRRWGSQGRRPSHWYRQQLGQTALPGQLTWQFAGSGSVVLRGCP
jgi:hypothetical protein